MSLLSEVNITGIVALPPLYFFRSITDETNETTIHVLMRTLKHQQAPKQKQHGLSTKHTLSYNKQPNLTSQIICQYHNTVQRLFSSHLTINLHVCRLIILL